MLSQDQLYRIYVDSAQKICSAASTEIVKHLGGSTNATALSPDALEKTLRASEQAAGGSKKIASLFGVNENIWSDFKSRLRLFSNVLATLPQGKAPDRNMAIIALRLICGFETLKDAAGFTYSTEITPVTDQDLVRGMQQVRALELVVRSLINEKYSNQDELIKTLSDVFNTETVQRWRKCADPGNILSGSNFGDVIQFFLRKQQYKEFYEPLFSPSANLRLFSSQNKTLGLFLDQVRDIRNKLVHHKNITSAEIALVNLYYEEIATPVQNAFDVHLTGVDPDYFFNADANTLKNYFNHAAKIMGAIGEDVTDIRAEMANQKPIIRDIHNDTRTVRRKLPLILGGIVVAGIAGFLTFGTSLRTLVDTTEIKSGVREVGTRLSNVKQETSDDPRKELSNIGISWTDESFQEALNRGDEKAVELFLEGGMSWKIYQVLHLEAQENEKSDAIVSMLADHVDLVQSRPKACLEFTHGLIHEIITGTSLWLNSQGDDPNIHESYMTPLRRKVLRSICSDPSDIGKLQDQETSIQNSIKEQQKKMSQIPMRDKAVASCIGKNMAGNAQPLLQEAAATGMTSLLQNSTVSARQVMLASIAQKQVTGDPITRSWLVDTVRSYCETEYPRITPISNETLAEAKAIQLMLDILN